MRPAESNFGASRCPVDLERAPEGIWSIREATEQRAAAAVSTSIRDGHDHRVRVSAGVRCDAGSGNGAENVDRLRRSVTGAEKAAVRGCAGGAAGSRGPGVCMGCISIEIVVDKTPGIRHPPLAAGHICSVVHGDGVRAAIGAGDRDGCAARLQGGRERCSGHAPEIERRSVDCASRRDGDLNGQVRGRCAGLGGRLITGCHGKEERDRSQSRSLPHSSLQQRSAVVADANLSTRIENPAGRFPGRPATFFSVFQ